MNQVIINGTIANNTISAQRTSGAIDLIPINHPPTAAPITITGTLCTYNTPDKKLHIFIKPTTTTPSATPQNTCTLTGYVCRTPKYRTTPNGKRITEITLAIPNPGEPSYYLPCIAWGSVAESAKQLEIGEEITVEGRVQSRCYSKNNTLHTTIEISVTHIHLTEATKTSKITNNKEK